MGGSTSRRNERASCCGDNIMILKSARIPLFLNGACLYNANFFLGRVPGRMHSALMILRKTALGVLETLVGGKERLLC